MGRVNVGGIIGDAGAGDIALGKTASVAGAVGLVGTLELTGDADEQFVYTGKEFYKDDLYTKKTGEMVTYTSGATTNMVNSSTPVTTTSATYVKRKQALINTAGYYNVYIEGVDPGGGTEYQIKGVQDGADVIAELTFNAGATAYNVNNVWLNGGSALELHLKKGTAATATLSVLRVQVNEGAWTVTDYTD